MLIAAVAGLSYGCVQMEEMRTYAPEDVVPPVLNPLDINDITVTDDNLDETVTFVWDAADFGVRAQVNYAIEVAYDDDETGETRRVTIQSGINGTSHEMTYEELNYTVGLAADMGGLGVPLETPSTVRFYVGASVGLSADVYWSLPMELTMSVIYAEPRYPNVWVIGKYSNWDHSRSQFLFSFDNNAEFEGIIDFGENAAENNGGTSDDVGFKLTGAANWNNTTGNWGIGAEMPDAEAEEITLVNNGGNIANVYTKRYYSLAYNTTTLELTRQYAFDRLVVYGDAVGEEQTMLFSTLDQEFYLDATLEDGTLNFALVDGSQRTVLGSATAGILDSENPITATAGNFRIYVDLNNSDEKTYEFNADDYGKEVDEEEEITDPTGHTWGIVSEKNNWGEPVGDEEPELDLAMVLDGDYYVRRNVSLTAGEEFKIRYDNDWFDADDNPTNFGADENKEIAPAAGQTYMAAVLVSNGGGNLYVSRTDEYDIYFNPELGYIHIRPAGSDAPGDIDWGLTGSFTGWEPGEDLPMVAAEGEGQEYYIYEGLELTEDAILKFRYGNMFRDGGDNAFGLPAGTPETGTNVTLNAPVALDADGGAAAIALSAGTYDLVLYPTQRTAYVISDPEGVTIPDRITWGITGTMTGWADNKDRLMVSSDGYYLLENTRLEAGAGFRFRYGNNDSGSSYGFSVDTHVSKSENVIALVSGGEGSLIVDEAGDYDIYLNPDYGFVYIKAHGDPAPSAVSFGIKAGITEGMPDLSMIQSGSEFVCSNVRFPASDAFTIRVSNNDGLVFGGTSSGTDTVIAAVEDGSAISILPGLYNIYFNYARKEIRVTGSVSDPQWGVVGTFNGWGNDWIMVEENGYLVCYGLRFDTDNIVDEDGGNSNAFKLRYGWNWDSGSVGAPGSENLEVPVNTAVNVVNNSGSKDLIVPEAGTYDIYFDPDALLVYVMDEGKTPADAETPEPVGHSYAIRGGAFGWDAGLAMTDNGTYGVATGIESASLMQPFKLYDNNTGLWYGRGGSDQYVHPIPVGEAVELYNNNHSSEGKSNVSLVDTASEGMYDVYFVYPAGTGTEDTGTIYIMNAGEVPEF